MEIQSNGGENLCGLHAGNITDVFGMMDINLQYDFRNHSVEHSEVIAMKK